MIPGDSAPSEGPKTVTDGSPEISDAVIVRSRVYKPSVAFSAKNYIAGPLLCGSALIYVSNGSSASKCAKALFYIVVLASYTVYLSVPSVPGRLGPLGESRRTRP